MSLENMRWFVAWVLMGMGVSLQGGAPGCRGDPEGSVKRAMT